MRHYQGCSIEEICRALDLRTNAAKHSIFRAVKKMRVALEPFVKPRSHGRVVRGAMAHPTDDELIEHFCEESGPSDGYTSTRT